MFKKLHSFWKEIEPYFTPISAVGGGMLGFFSPIVEILGVPLSILVGCIVVLSLLLLTKFTIKSLKNANKPLEKEMRKKFLNQTIRLDGKDFVDCTFTSCTLEYEGGDFHLNNSNISENCRFTFLTKESQATAKLISSLQPFVSSNNGTRLALMDEYNREVIIVKPRNINNEPQTSTEEQE